MFSDELHIFFQYLGRKILSEVDLKNPLESVFYGHATDTINKYWVEYDKILSHYVDKAAIIGNVHYEILLNASKDRAEHFQATKAKNNPRQFLDNELSTSDNNELFAPNPKVSSRLKRKKFEASEKTRARVDKEINNILGEAYREGWGPRYVGDKIRQRFTDLSTYEARRIAQTEINTTRNYVQYQRMQDDEMEYKIWHAAHDSRTRKSHLKVDEEIVPINERFSNGLMYPGDKDGPIEEWVNCRCSHAAYIMPLGYEAPDFFPFTESDLVKVGSSTSQDYVPGILERLGILDGVMVRQQEFDQAKFDDLRTPEEIAEFFELEYLPNGRQEYAQFMDGKFMEFYDKKHEVHLRFYKDKNNKIREIDYTNKGKGVANLKDVVKVYKEAPQSFKEATNQITYVRSNKFTTAGQCDTHGNIDIYDSAFLDNTPRRGVYRDTWETTTWHEMFHALDFALHDMGLYNKLIIEKDANGYHRINKTMEREWAKATQKDKSYQKKNGLKVQDTTIYGEDAASEDIAEMAGVISAKVNGRNYATTNAYSVKKPCPERTNGCRTRQTIDEIIEANPNRAKLMEKWINQKFDKDLKHNKIVERNRFEAFLKEEAEYQKKYGKTG